LGCGHHCVCGALFVKKMDKIARQLPVKNILKYRKKIRIDNVVFNLHKATAGLLLFISIFISTTFLLKDPIECIHDKTVEHVINGYCWITATYTLPDRLNGNMSDIASVPHPGVATLTEEDDPESVRVHKYYQWVAFVLFFQAFTFYFPRAVWKHNEGGKLKSMCSSLEEDLTTKDDAEMEKTQNTIQAYFCKTMGHNDLYALNFALCEVLNFINVIIQIDLTDRFLNRALSSYGLGLLQFQRQDPMYRTDALSVVFPMVAKCTFHMVGPSGNIIPYDSLCVLPFNMYTEKFYPILWIWFITLAVISGLALVYRVATFLFPELRYQLLVRKFTIGDDELDETWELNKKFDYGDWYILYQIGKNIGPLNFLTFLKGVASRVNASPATSNDNDSLGSEPPSPTGSGNNNARAIPNLYSSSMDKLTIEKEKYL